MKRIYKVVVAGAVLAAVLAGCTGHFEEYNKNPNNPYQKDLSDSEAIIGLFPPLVNIIHLSQQNRCQYIEQMIGQYGGHVACSSVWDSGGATHANLSPAERYYASPWEDIMSDFYVNYSEVMKLINKNEGEDRERIMYLFHMAKIFRVATQHRMADIYGPIPYSSWDNVGEGPGTFDSEKEVYVAMMGELNDAIDYLTDIAENNKDAQLAVGPYDFVYGASTGGLLAKWVKYANSLKLRLAVRIALKNEPAGFAAEAIEEVMTHSIGPIMVNADNALNSSIPENETAGYYCATSWGDLKVNATLTTYMNALKDPRLPKYMKPGTQTTPYNYADNIGVRMGAAIGETNQFFDTGDDTNPTEAPETYTIMNTTTPQPVLLFCAAETHFLLAEAAQRGWWGDAADAKKYYESGIEMSMQQYGVSKGDYMSETITAAEAIYSDPRDASTGFDMFASFSDLTPASVIAVAWEAQDTDAKKLEAIITQKWLALYTMGVESWCDWRRTGYPRIFPAVNDRSGGAVDNPVTEIKINLPRMMRRIKYPNITLGSQGHNAAVEMLGSDEFGTELWWAKDTRQQP